MKNWSKTYKYYLKKPLHYKPNLPYFKIKRIATIITSRRRDQNRTKKIKALEKKRVRNRVGNPA